MGPLLVLWDIDHTLLDTGEVGRDAYAAAFRAATGRSLRRPWRFDGRTELAAATDEMRAHGLDPESGVLEAFLERLVAEFSRRTTDMAAGGRVLPGAVEALTALGALPNIHQSVLTGNLYPIAALKLTVFGLAGHLDLRLGAYGRDAYERGDLPEHSYSRTERHLGRRYSGVDTVIVGDTLRDIATAHGVGARAVAVASGTVSAERLTVAGADVVLPDLADTVAVLSAVTGSSPQGDRCVSDLA